MDTNPITTTERGWKAVIQQAVKASRGQEGTRGFPYGRRPAERDPARELNN